jgi:hypothetical protein
MDAQTASTERLDFSVEEREKFTAVFSAAFEKLKQSMPSHGTAEQESNNHFDEQFHQELLNNNLHLKEKFVNV